MDISEVNYPNVRPTLNLNFSRTKCLSPLINFNRSSGGSYVNSKGDIEYVAINQPRFDHNPITGESLGLLIEESRTNTLTDSVNFISGWGNSNIIFNAISNHRPFLYNNTVKIIPDSSLSNQHSYNRISQVPALTSQDTFSFYAKSDGYRYVFIRFDGVAAGLGGGAIFDLENGEVSSQIRGTGLIRKFTDGWFRCSFTARLTNQLGIRIGVSVDNLFNSNAYPTTSFVGNNINGILLAAPQYESGAFPTSYIPTLVSARTRAADNASISGRNFSEFYNKEEGTIYSSYISNRPLNSLNAVDFGIVDSVNSTKSIISGFNNVVGNPFFSVIRNNLQNFVIGRNIDRSFKPTKKILTFKDYDIIIAVEGVLIGGDILETVPDIIPKDLTTLLIGFGGGIFGSYLNGTISQIIYYPSRLSNNELRLLTR